MHVWFIVFAVLSLNALGQKLVVLDVEGIDFQAENVEDFPHAAGQIRYHQDHLYFRNYVDRKVFIATTTGRIIETIGQPGNGPGAFPSRLNSFGLHKDQVFILSRKRKNQLFTFTNRQLSHSFETDFELFCKASIDTNPLAVSENFVIVPAHPKTGFLATAYSRDGKAIPFGEILFDKRDIDLLQKNRCLNEMLWVFGKNHLYGIMKYQPTILEFDTNFNLVNSTNLENPRLSQLVTRLDELDPNRFKTLPGLFFDLQIQGDTLYLMASRTLFAIDLGRMQITDAYAFRGVGKAFKDKDPTSHFHFATFALAENGFDLYLGPARSLDADLLISRLPESRPNPTEKGDSP